MSFSRENIRKNAKECGIESIPKEFENWLVDEHLASRDTYADAQVKKALEENKPQEPTPVKDTEEYKALEKEFNTFKEDTAKKETAAAKEKAAREFFESKGFKGQNLDIVMRGSQSEVTGLELADGKVKSFESLEALASGVYSGLVTNATVTGVKTANPPAASKVEEQPKNLAEALKQQYTK